VSLIVPRPSSLLFLNGIIVELLESAELCLFKNDYTPIATTVLADFTEADFDGYARIVLSGWPAAALDANDKASTELAAQTFTKSGAVTANTIYGVFVLDDVGNLLYAERNPAGGVVINTAGQTYSYLPRFTDKSEF